MTRNELREKIAEMLHVTIGGSIREFAAGAVRADFEAVDKVIDLCNSPLKEQSEDSQNTLLKLADQFIKHFDEHSKSGGTF